ncbi:lipoxygenase homology domain-containing protein 1-like [Physella acuta]|uniref:lipoxygenase homology domain-containing protein 1-like n=1 Tax=Physella acuta TaxID=109671 RepID=UPI0027DCACA5|nr:lipoxygenase homology domain-containing protein 1-like [Physella acuta]
MSITSFFGLLCALLLFQSGFAELMDYKIRVRTGTVKSAGTDASIFIIMHGNRGSTDRIPLRDPDGRRFERGSLDYFTGTTEFIGQLKSITIGHNNGGWQAGWFLEDVRIGLYQHNTFHQFAYYEYQINWNNWIAGDELDGTIVKTIPARYYVE